MNDKIENMPRRSAILGLVGGSAAIALAGLPRASAAATAAATPVANAIACVLRPKQTEGPYFVDEKLNRSDIRSEPADGIAKAGTELRLTFNVLRMDGNACKPLEGAIVDVWHCDAAGVYSDVKDEDARSDTRGKKFLRGYQVTDKNGAVSFVTIYPGWYPGRTVHIHFKIRCDSAPRGAREFTSQLYFDDALSDLVFAGVAYAARGKRDRKNPGDGIYRNGGKELTLAATKDAKGDAYAASFDVGLQFS